MIERIRQHFGFFRNRKLLPLLDDIVKMQRIYCSEVVTTKNYMLYEDLSKLFNRVCSIGYDK